MAELRRQLEEVEERERRIVLARDETTSIGSSSALSAAEAAYHRELEEGLEMELQGLREENRALAHAVDAARVELQGAEKRAQDLRERLNKVQKLGVASIAASASAASSAASGVPGVAETSGITGAATEVGTSSAVDRPDPAALEDASTVASAPLDVLSEPFPGSLLEVLRERERERAEGGREGGEGEGTWEGGAGGDGEGLFAGDEEVAEVIERLTRIVHNEMEVHSVAQYTVKKLAAAAQQLEELQRREEELVHVWQDTQERVQQLTQQLSSAEATAQRHMEELSNVAHHSHTTQVSAPCVTVSPIDELRMAPTRPPRAHSCPVGNDIGPGCRAKHCCIRIATESAYPKAMMPHAPAPLTWTLFGPLRCTTGRGLPCPGTPRHRPGTLPAVPAAQGRGLFPGHSPVEATTAAAAAAEEGARTGAKWAGLAAGDE